MTNKPNGASTWLAVCAIAGTGLIAWGSTLSQVSTNAENIDALQAQQDQADRELDTLKNTLTRVETRQEAIQDDLLMIRQDLRDLIRRIQQTQE